MHNQSRNYKDTVFVDLFGKCPEARENFLSLYNAMHRTNLTLADTKVEPIMLEKTIYRQRYNDVSMLVNGQIIVLVEQQSTINENMPLRFLEYIARLYEKIIPLEERYKSKMSSLPNPEFYVFYNGNTDYPAETTLKLSDAFYNKNKNPILELSVKVYNINKHGNLSFLENCSSLYGYVKLVEYAKQAKAKGTDDYLGYAIQRCIKEGLLADYLNRNSSEVRNMLIAEYDYDTDIRVQRQEAFEDGIAQQKAEDEKWLEKERSNFATITAQKDAEIAELKAQLAKALQK